ncbi:hypothetical protein MAM1_0137c06322 [Mucor ambiguus]|uniref:Uncharacterized protein n=1 Tax=Mucor ambiguus TaxID=91626 RepID=A0A0C9MTU5_9FUNG|nr:hypothetical protein MAM1_0137c06322 [Mucor ambiguus]
MSADIASIDPKHKEAIVSAIAEISAAGIPMSVNVISQQLSPTIVNGYDDTSFFIYKAVWVRRIISTLQLFDIPYKKSKINWENIFCLIQDKKLGIYNVENIPNLYDASSSKTTTSRAASEKSSSSSGGSSMMKQALLEPEDKIAIEELYKNLNPMNMWKLSSGTIVEKKNGTICSSLHLRTEIKTFKLKRLPNLPTDLENYFDSLLLLSTENDLDKLYIDVKAANFHPKNDEALAWAQTTVLNTIKLFMSNYFPLSDQSEADILRRIWLLIDTVFDYSAIKSRSGEKSSTSSSDGLNAARTIANINQAARKLMGRKVDMVYKLQPNEYGCMECGKDENNSTKELSDGMFKIPIIMKDMFNSLAKKTPSLVNDITISSLMIMETKISLIIMDSPGGNVCRISRLKPLYFPVCSLNFMSSLVSIMKLVYTARLNMEKTYLLIAKNEPALEYDLGEDPPIPPTFHKNLKRKRDFSEDDNDKSNTEKDDTASNA